jgi:hypothetical protein
MRFSQVVVQVDRGWLQGAYAMLTPELQAKHPFADWERQMSKVRSSTLWREDRNDWGNPHSEQEGTDRWSVKFSRGSLNITSGIDCRVRIGIIRDGHGQFLVNNDSVLWNGDCWFEAVSVERLR